MDHTSDCCCPCRGVADCDISGLLEMLGSVPDCRKARGRVHEMVFVLAVSLVSVLAGASNFREIGDQAADLPQSLLRVLGARWCHFRGAFRWPSERTIRRVLGGVDADVLDRVSGTWLRQAAVVDARASSDAGVGLVLAMDGKVLRGSWTDENGMFTLFSAMVHEAGVTVAQVEVPPGTNEITQVKSLLETVSVSEGEHVVVTADAAHTQRDTAAYLKGERGFDYVLQAKGNQPKLLDAVFEKVAPLLQSDPDHVVAERAHGRVNQWETWATDAAGIDFPHVEQVACIRRKVFTLGGDCVRKEYVWILTSSTEADAQALHVFVRNHWGIENKSHYVRDTTWHEDAHQAYVGNGPRVMATIRNLAAGLFRLNGHQKIKEATEWIARDRSRALPLLAT